MQIALSLDTFNTDMMLDLAEMYELNQEITLA